MEKSIEAAFSTEKNEIHIDSQFGEWYNEDWVVSSIESAMSEINNSSSSVSISGLNPESRRDEYKKMLQNNTEVTAAA